MRKVPHHFKYFVSRWSPSLGRIKSYGLVGEDISMEIVSESLKKYSQAISISYYSWSLQFATSVMRCSCHNYSFLLSRFPSMMAYVLFPSESVNLNKTSTLLVALVMVFYYGNTKEANTCD